MADEFPITVTINGRKYPLTIERSKEQKYRDAAKFVNETVAEYAKTHPGLDLQDFLSMTAFQLACTVTELKENADKSPVIAELRQIDENMSRFLLEDK